jgi:hypothetical protein
MRPSSLHQFQELVIHSFSRWSLLVFGMRDRLTKDFGSHSAHHSTSFVIILAFKSTASPQFSIDCITFKSTASPIRPDIDELVLSCRLLGFSAFSLFRIAADHLDPMRSHYQAD